MKTVNFLILATLMSILACKSTKLSQPMEQYDRFEEKVSRINIPVSVKIEELERTINQQIEGIIYEDDTFDDGDKMMVKAEKKSNISLRIDSQMVKYQVPLGLWIKYDLGLGKVSADAEITLDFSTAFVVNDNWTIETQTNVTGYEWQKKPRLSMAGLSIPVGFVGNLILNRSREFIGRSLDEQVAQNLRLDTLIGDTWKQLFEPIPVAPEYNAWLVINPQKIGMTPLEAKDGALESILKVDALPTIILGDKPQVDIPQSLPPFHYEPGADDDIELHLKTEISYLEAERIAKNQLLGERFEQGKNAVTIEDIQLYGQGNNIVVNTRLSGSYNGSIFLTGKPVFNEKRGSIDVEDLNFTLETRNFLFKSAGWLLKSTIKNKIKDNLNFLLDYNLGEIESQIKEQLQDFEVTKGTKLKGELGKLGITNAYLTSDGIRLDIGINGKVKLQVSELIPAK
ncbi:MAG: hypothetical protein DHS20C18_50540 [Saprospiraceae bacterium]|nr:MAG: hypothetical protein DHS20C18_50540 [Saprospiraceae bacterium]